VGLSGELRPVPNGQDRLQEAAKHGFKQAIVPEANKPKKAIGGLAVLAVNNLSQLLDAVAGLT
jgi:DNA repair protein RadA/Sms